MRLEHPACVALTKCLMAAEPFFAGHGSSFQENLLVAAEDALGTYGGLQMSFIKQRLH